jgi:hypothetical protein
VLWIERFEHQHALGRVLRHGGGALAGGPRQLGSGEDRVRGSKLVLNKR